MPCALSTSASRPLRPITVIRANTRAERGTLNGYCVVRRSAAGTPCMHAASAREGSPERSAPPRLPCLDRQLGLTAPWWQGNRRHGSVQADNAWGRRTARGAAARPHGGRHACGRAWRRPLPHLECQGLDNPPMGPPSHDTRKQSHPRARPCAPFPPPPPSPPLLLSFCQSCQATP